MSDLISDNRLLRQAEALQAQLFEKVTYLLSLPSSVWSSFSLHAQCAAETLRDLVVKGAIITWGYLDVKFFQFLSFYPWSLVVGDLEKNLENDEEAHQPLPATCRYVRLIDRRTRTLSWTSIQGLNTCLKTTSEKENNKILTSLHTDNDSLPS
eukprot:5887690-Amphidinium_carterae.1